MISTLVFSLTLFISIFSSELIHSITESNINKLAESTSMWFIQISNDRCDQCESHNKQIIQAAKLLQGIVKFGKAPAKLFPQAPPKNPSYYFYGGNIKNLQLYQSKIQKVAITKFCLDQIEKVVKKRNKQGFGNNKNQNRQSKKSQNSKSYDRVIVLTDQNFQKMVLKSDQAWFVEFYSPSCGHCQALQPEWDKLPKIMKERANIAKIDATKNPKMAQKYQIKGFPTMLLFDTKSKQNPIPYNGQRTSQALSSWLSSQNIGVEKRQFTQLTQQVYEKECNKNIVCLIFLFEKNSDKNKLSFIKDIMQNNINKPLRFFYGSGLLNFQQELMIEDRSYPKMISVWDSINSYRVYNSAMTETDLESFIGKIMERKAWIRFSSTAKNIIFKKVLLIYEILMNILRNLYELFDYIQCNITLII